MEVKKDGGDVDAITASTITSRAFCDALKRAHAAFKANFVNQADTTKVQ
jgi:electron transport complex protein RnfG